MTKTVSKINFQGARIDILTEPESRNRCLISERVIQITQKNQPNKKKTISTGLFTLFFTFLPIT